MLPLPPDRKASRVVSPDAGNRDTPWGRVGGLIAGKEPKSPERSALAIRAELLAAGGRIKLDGDTPNSELPDKGRALTSAVSMNNFYGPIDREARGKVRLYAQTQDQFDALLPDLIAAAEKSLTEADPDRRRALAEMAVGRKLREIVNS